MPAKITNGLTAWSYSRLSTYRKCPRQARYRYIDKLQVDEQKSPALLRGNKIDEALEQFVKRQIKKLPKELEKSLGPLLPAVVGWRSDATVGTQLERAVTKDWQPTGWFAKDAWLRAKLDVRAIRITAGTQLHIVDYKSGKEYPGQHQEQGELYVAVEAAHHPTANEALVEFFYVDHGRAVPHLYQDLSVDVPRLRKKWEKLAKPFFKDTKWVPRPGMECRWCPFSNRKGGPCEAG